jgi:hypothetical protein
MKELEDRKRALLAESEVYRQTLKLEIYNLRLFVKQSKLNVKSFASPSPWMLLTALAPLLARRSNFLSKWRLIGTVVAGWKMYSRFNPLIMKLWSTFNRRRQIRRRVETDLPAARI